MDCYYVQYIMTALTERPYALKSLKMGILATKNVTANNTFY